MEKLWRYLWFIALMGTVILGDDLLLVHMILIFRNKCTNDEKVWRHGSRSPMTKCPNDKYDEFLWPQGWDQLLPTGMEEHVNFGVKLYERYSVKYPLVSGVYNVTEVYVRSSDHDTTLQSAMSNFIGFYNADSAKANGIDYPNILRWPKGYTPVPIHTVPFDTDHLLNQNAYCPRQKWLWSMVMKTPEYIKLERSSVDLLRNLSKKCGLDVTLTNLWLYRDSFQIELAQGMNLLVSGTTLNKMIAINNILDSYQTGVGLADYDGIDFNIEIGKIRGGSLLWDILNRANHKIKCRQNQATDCQSINRLKYYIYSASDKTIAALLSTFGAEKKVFPNGGYPAYTAALAIELWNTSNGPAFKFLYRHNSTSDLTDITSLVDGCQNDYCAFKTIRENSKKYYPGSITKLCEDTSSKRTLFDPDRPSSAPILPISLLVTLLAYLTNILFI